MGTWATSPSRTTRAVMTIILCSAATLDSALPSWLRPMTALKTVRKMSPTPVQNWPGRKSDTRPAARSTTCMGSLYWRRKARQRGSLAASDSLLGP